MKITRIQKHFPRGLTLLELVVVLAILAAVATIAVRSLEGRLDQTRFEATQRQLREIEEAILGPANLRQPDGSLSASGFVSDMGRLPYALQDGTDFQPAELWTKPAIKTGFPDNDFRIRLSTNANISLAQTLTLPTTTPTLTPTTAAALIPADATVLVPCGWRGPYLQLSPGVTQLKDSSSINGNPFHLYKIDGTLITSFSANTEVAQFESWGANEKKDVNDSGYDVDLGISLMNRYSGSISGTVELTIKNGDALDSVKIRLFSPDPESGYIKVIEQEISNPVAAVLVDTPVSIPFIFDKSIVTIGTRVLKAYSTKTAAGVGPYKAGNATTVVVPPGGISTVTLRFNP